MSVRIGINGFGRIGRDVCRAAAERAGNDLRIVAVNDVTSPATLAHLLRYDSTYGTWRHHVDATEDSILVDDEVMRVFREPDPSKLPWGELGVAFGVHRGLMTTIHSYTNDQSLLGSPHNDLRRARSAAVNITPTSTGAATAVGEVLPELRGQLSGVAVRVPVVDGSLTDLTVELGRPVTVAEINHAFAEAAAGRLKGILRYTEDPVVSRDIIGDPASCVLDAGLTTVDGPLAKVFGWYDNEWGYANRTLDLVALMSNSP